MDSGHFTRSQARKTSLVSNIPSDVEPDDVAPESQFGTRKVASYGCGEARVHTAEASCAPVCPDGGCRRRNWVGELSLCRGPPECHWRPDRPTVWTDEFHANRLN